MPRPRPTDMQRAARIIGAVGALAVAAFALLLVALLAPGTRPGSILIGIAYLGAAAIILLAPRASASLAAFATAKGTSHIRRGSNGAGMM